MGHGVIFDFDGVVIDSESTVLRAWQEEYERHGLALDPAVWSTQIGRIARDADEYATLASLVGDAFSRDEADVRRRARERELVERQPVLDGVREWLLDAQRHGIGTAVASSSSRRWVGGHLERLGLRDLFDVVCCRDDVERTKPAPDLYLLAAERLGLPPSACIAVEDSRTGSEAAVAAGCFTIVVPGPLTVDHEFTGHHRRVVSLAQVELLEVLDGLARGGLASGP